jgi:hypothetical protein
MKTYFDLRQQNPDQAELIAEQLNRYLEEKALVLGKGENYGQAVILAGGAGSGKSFAVSNFMQGEKFKVFNVDSLKDTLLSIRDRLKRVPDMQLSGGIKSVVQAIQDLNLRKPKDVGTLHMMAKKLGGRDPNDSTMIGRVVGKVDDTNFHKQEDILSLKELIKDFNVDQKNQIMFFADKTKSVKPNVMFDVTLKDIGALHNELGGEFGIIQLLKMAGYAPENIHIVWILTDYRIAMRQNLTRSRVVASDIFFATHLGASGTMRDIVFKNYSSLGINGDIAVILGGGKGQVEFEVGKSYGPDTKSTEGTPLLKGGLKGKSFTVTSANKLTLPVFIDSRYYRLKKAGDRSINREALQSIHDAISKMAPSGKTGAAAAQAQVVRKIMSDFNGAQKLILQMLHRGVSVEQIKSEYRRKFPPLKPIHPETAAALGLSELEYKPVLDQRVADILGLKVGEYKLRS